MTEENNVGKHLYESHALNSILSEYKETLHGTQIQKEDFEEGVHWLYEHILKKPNPKIFYCNSPDQIQGIDKKSKKINRLTVESALWWNIYERMNTKNMQIEHVSLKRILTEELDIDYYNVILDIIYGYSKNGINLKKELAHVALVDFHVRLNSFDMPDFPCFKKLCCSGVYHIFFWEECVYALTKAPTLRYDEIGLLHATVYPAIEWPGGAAKAYYIHGREMPGWIFTDYGTDELYHRFIAEENEDIRSGIITMIKERDGDKGFLNFLKAELIDEKEVAHFSGYKEILRLYKTKETFDYLYNRHMDSNQPYCWSGFTCPSTGAIYLIDNSADFTDAIEAAKFLRPSFIPQKLPYQWKHDAC